MFLTAHTDSLFFFLISKIYSGSERTISKAFEVESDL